MLPRLLLLVLGAALPVRGAGFIERPVESAASHAAPRTAGAAVSLDLRLDRLMSAAASLPKLELPGAPVLQAHALEQGPALPAQALVSRFAEPGYRERLIELVGPQRAKALEAIAVERAAEQEAPQGASIQLSVLQAHLAPLGEQDPLAGLSALELAFEGARPSDEGALPLAAGAEGALASLSPATAVQAAPVVEIPAPHAEGDHAHKALGLKDLVGLGINSIIGAGIFVKPALLARQAGVSSVFAFPLTALILLPVGLSFAEAATYFHGKDGGAYQYTRAAFGDTGAGRAVGDWVSFGVTWMAWVASILSWAAVTSVIAVNLSYFAPGLAAPLAAKAVAAAVIGIISFINYRGVKEGAAVSNAFAVAKLVPMFLFVLVGLAMLHPGAFAHAAPKSAAAFSGACFMTVFALMGFENIAVPGGEVREPAKNVPRAVMLSLLVSSLIYAGIQVVCVGVLPGLSDSAKPVVDAGFAVFGAIGAGLMALTAFFSTTGDSAAAALFGARFVKVLADDKHLPGSSWISRVHERFKTPSVAILLTCGLTIAAVFLPVEKLMDVATIAVVSQYIGTCLALPFLRKRRSAPEGAFRLPLGPVIPLVGAASAIALAIAGGAESLGAAVWILGAGLALKFLAGRFKRA